MARYFTTYFTCRKFFPLKRIITLIVIAVVAGIVAQSFVTSDGRDKAGDSVQKPAGAVGQKGDGAVAPGKADGGMAGVRGGKRGG